MVSFSYGWAQDRAVELAVADPTNLKFCLQAPAATRHFIALVLRGWEKRGKSPASFGRLAADVHAKTRADLVEEYWGFRPSNGLTKMLNRLGPRTLSRAGYDHLAAILRDDQRRSLAVQRSCLSTGDLRTLATTDIALIESAGVLALKALGRESLDLAVRAVQARRPELSRIAILKKLKNCTSQHDLEVNALKFLDHVEIEVPWQGNEILSPIRTIAEARSFANSFRNCLDTPNRMWEMLIGRSVFYVAAGGPLVAQLHWDPMIRIWYVDEIQGFSNRRPPARALSRARRAFRDAGFQSVPRTRPNWMMYE